MPFLTEVVYQRLTNHSGWRTEEDLIVCQSLERQMTPEEIRLQLDRSGFLRELSQVKERITELLMAGRQFDTLEDFRANEAQE